MPVTNAFNGFTLRILGSSLWCFTLSPDMPHGKYHGNAQLCQSLKREHHLCTFCVLSAPPTSSLSASVWAVACSYFIYPCGWDLFSPQPPVYVSSWLGPPTWWHWPTLDLSHPLRLFLLLLLRVQYHLLLASVLMSPASFYYPAIGQPSAQLSQSRSSDPRDLQGLSFLLAYKDTPALSYRSF